MKFAINYNLLTQARSVLAKRKNLYWLVGGAGAGKTTVCQTLSKKFDLQIYDMDAHIYGTYHTRFTAARHPVNTLWSSAENGLAWLLDMSWDQFNQFNQAALPEYIDLLAEDIAGINPATPVLIDGGICNPALVTQVIPGSQMVGLALAEQPGANLWEVNEERNTMRASIDQLPEPEQKWQKFLEFDRRITQTILEECTASGIVVCSRTPHASVAEFTAKVGQVLGF